MINISNTFFKKMNLYAIWFLVTFGLLLQISASSVQGLNQYDDNFYFIKRHVGLFGNRNNYFQLSEKRLI
jgi:hypothetical protein